MSKIKIPYVNLTLQWNEDKETLLPIIDKILSTGQYVGGKEIERFEKNILSFTNTKYAVALNSGTDALTLGMHLLGIKKGDEVITPPNSFIASTAAIVHLGAKPVFVDVLENQNMNPLNIEKVSIELELKEDLAMIESQVVCSGKTGVEMEALTAVSVAALTFYDMCKAINKGICIENIELLHKSGGKSGDYSKD